MANVVAFLWTLDLQSAGKNGAQPRYHAVMVLRSTTKLCFTAHSQVWIPKFNKEQAQHLKEKQIYHQVTLEGDL